MLVKGTLGSNVDDTDVKPCVKNHPSYGTNRKYEKNEQRLRARRFLPRPCFSGNKIVMSRAFGSIARTGGKHRIESVFIMPSLQEGKFCYRQRQLRLWNVNQCRKLWKRQSSI